jgi:hypothetical protein
MNGEGLRTWNMEVHKNLVHQERILRVVYYWFRFPEATQIFQGQQAESCYPDDRDSRNLGLGR